MCSEAGAHERTWRPCEAKPVHRRSVQSLDVAAYWVARVQCACRDDMTMRDMRSHSRDALSPELFRNSLSLSKQRAQGMPGARCTRGLVCKLCKERLHTSIQVSGEHPASPAQWLYGLYRALPGGAGLLSPSPADLLPELDASIAAPGPHDFAVRVSVSSGASRRRHQRPPQSHPNVGDDGQRPSSGTRWSEL